MYVYTYIQYMIVCYTNMLNADCSSLFRRWFRGTHLSCGFDSFPDAEVAEYPGQQQAESDVPVRSERHVPCLSDDPIPGEDREADRQVDWQADRQAGTSSCTCACI